MTSPNPFRELLNLFFESWEKYGYVDENGYMWLDDGFARQRCGRIK